MTQPAVKWPNILSFSRKGGLDEGGAVGELHMLPGTGNCRLVSRPSIIIKEYN